MFTSFDSVWFAEVCFAIAVVGLVVGVAAAVLLLFLSSLMLFHGHYSLRS